MTTVLQPSNLKGTVHAPASKSSMQRALAAALMAKGRSIIHNPGSSNDDKAAIGIIEALGALIENEDSPLLKVNHGDLIINSEGVKPIIQEINCHESGLAIRMFIPIIALHDQPVTINGEGSLRNRPLDFFEQVLPQLNVSVKSNNGKVPLVVCGPLQPANIEIDGSLSSQFLTGLIMAYSAAGANNVSIKVKDLKSKPYIDLTLDVMKHFGLTTPSHENYEVFHFQRDETSLPANFKLRTSNYTVEGDWSGAAFLLVAGAIAGPIVVRGLDLSSPQGDKAIVDALMQAQAAIAIDAKGITVHQATMKGFEFDATDCPDLFPPLAVLAAFCKGKTKLSGVHRLIHKESNRAQTIKDELGKMGVCIELDEDNMIVHGGNRIVGATVSSRHDHRIAMACAIAALKAEGKTTIEDADAVKKSYPSFFNDLKSLGAVVSLPR